MVLWHSVLVIVHQSIDCLLKQALLQHLPCEHSFLQDMIVVLMLYIYVCMYISVFIYIYIYVCVCIYIYIYLACNLLQRFQEACKSRNF